MARRVTSAALLVVLVLAGGCGISRKITHRTALADVPATDHVRVYDQEHRFYQLRNYTLADSVLRGAGTVEQEDGNAMRFDGEIPLSSIVAIEARSSSALKGLAVAGMAVLFISVVGDGNNADAGLHAVDTISYQPPFSGNPQSSCPYVYSWNGKRYVLEAEPFGTSWGKALEMTTHHLLPSTRPEDGIVRLRLANERQETHYVNSLKLVAIDLGAAPAAVLDENGVAWPLRRAQPPITAADESERSILPEVAAADGKMWECDPSALTAGSGYENVLEFAFARPRGSSEGSLLLTGTNTALSTVVLRHLYGAVGDHALALAYAIETDPELIGQLKRYLDDAAFQVTVWNGAAWEDAGAFRPEANAVTFTRALRIRVPEDADETVRVRLRSMADVWKIDAITADWTPASPLPMIPLDLLSAEGPAGEDLRETLDADDGSYAVLFPPDRVELRFAAATPRPGANVMYAVAGRGYLHEWLSPAADAVSAAFVARVPGERRIDVLKQVLRHRETALQPVYAEWARDRTR